MHTTTEKTTLASRRSAQQGRMDGLHFGTGFFVSLIYSSGWRKMNVHYKTNEMYQELELYDGDIKIGEAEIDITNKMLSRLVIFEPYQNKGYGTSVVKALIDEYGCNCLWVNADNERAIHVYEKCGFRIVKPTMYLMETEDE